MKSIKLILFFIVIFAGSIRFWQITELGYFMMDEERDAFLVRRMLVDKRPLLIGGAIPGGINVGPLFFYISAIPYALSNLNPIGPAYAASVVGILSVAAVYLIGRKLFDEKIAILATVFSGFSLLNIIYHRPWWPLILSQPVTLITYLSLFKLTKSANYQRLNDLNHLTVQRNQQKWLLILTSALIVGAQSDPSTLSLIPLAAIWLWWKRKQVKLSRGLVLAMIGIFLLAHTTWLIFELRHDFLNSRAAVGLFSKAFKGSTLAYAKVEPYEHNQVFKMTAGVLYRLFIPTGYLDVTKQISPAEEFLRPRLEGIWWPGAWGLLVGIFIYIFWASKGLTLNPQGETLIDKLLARQILSLHFLVSISGILIYTAVFPGYVHEWMWAFMFPVFFLMFSDVAVSVWKFTKHSLMGSFVNFPIVTVMMVWCIWQLSLFSRLTNAAGLGPKLKLVQQAQQQIAGRPYELRSEGPDSLRYGGWRYLFTLYGDPPIKSYMDYVYQDWLYPKNKVEPEVVVVVNNLQDETATFTLSEYSESRISPDNQNF